MKKNFLLMVVLGMLIVQSIFGEEKTIILEQTVVSAESFGTSSRKMAKNIRIITKKEIEEIFNWTNNNEALQNKARIINKIYQEGNAYQKKAVSVLLESFLFYSGFYTPLYYLGTNKLVNVAEMIKLILRDESTHGTYIGYKAQKDRNELSEDEQEKMIDWTYDIALELYENELVYTHLLYDNIGWTNDVDTFVKYNCNKALMNLGLDPMFPETEKDVNPIVMNGISTGTSNHDFFSQVGNGYLMGEVEGMSDEDYKLYT